MPFVDSLHRTSQINARVCCTANQAEDMKGAVTIIYSNLTTNTLQRFLSYDLHEMHLFVIH